MSHRQVIADRYEIMGTLGQGGMGDVYRGVDRDTGQPVAIKLLKPDIVENEPGVIERFEREGEALRQLNHPNIVQMLASLDEDEMHYLVMEYVGGGSLRALINREGALPIRQAMEIALDVADALTRAHRLNIIHRDIKPDNVLLAEDGTPRLTDFGVARLGNRTRMTETGSVIGTFAYLSPEGCRSEDLDARTDVWSFGVMLFEMLAGRRPFEQKQAAAMVYAIINDPVPDLTELRPDAPPALAHLIQQMLTKDRDQRIRSVRQVGAELEEIMREIDTGIQRAVSLDVTVHEPASRFATPTPPDAALGMTARGELPTQLLSTEKRPKRSRSWRVALAGSALAVLIVVVVVVAALALGGGGGGKGPEAALVAAVAPGDTMVLVAQLEPLGGVAERDVTRFLVEDLTEKLDTGVPFSNIRIRAYPQLITTDEDARAAADANDAAIIVWGNYTPDFVELKIQIGSTASYHYLRMERAIVERTANSRARLTDERRESVAIMVLFALNALQIADGDGFETSRLNAILAELTSASFAPAEVLSGGLPTLMYRFAVAFPTDLEQALAEIDAALALDSGNPLLYAYRCATRLRAGLIEQSIEDCETAQRLGPEGWAMPLFVYSGRGYATGDVAASLAYWDQIVAVRPDDWYAYNFRGALHYMQGEYDLARADYDRAIELGPKANFPYVFASMVALRQGRFADAQTYARSMLARFPDPDFSNRLAEASWGRDVFGPIIAANGYLLIGQYQQVIEAAEAALAINDQLPDMYLAEGISYCNLEDYPAAEAAYTRAIDLEPDFAALYVLRAEVEQKQGDLLGSGQDILKAQTYDLGPEFAALIQAAATGAISCQNLFDYTLPTPDETGAAPTVELVEPVAPGEYMVLVAPLEPLGGVTERDVTRFVVDDLDHTIGRDVPFSKIRIRAYPQIIASEAEARAAAQANGAAVIVWGNYDPDAIELEIQVGLTTAFPYNAFPRQTLEKTGNVRVRMTDERRESVALPVIGVLNVLDMADGDQFEFVLALTIIAVLDVQSAEITGGDVGAHLHRALVAYIEDPQRAISELDDALVLDGGNPLLYAYRAVTHVRAGNFAEAEIDMQTAERLGPDGWAMPAYFSGGSTPEEALENVETVTELRPDDWFAYFAWGIIMYTDLNDPDAAKALLDQSIALGPEASMPYVPSMLIALRDGRIADAQNFARIILTEFPDPELIILAYSTLYGDAVSQGQFTSAYFSTATNIVLGQYARVTQEMVAVEEAVTALPADQEVTALADMFLFQGLAYCNLDDYAQAEAAYSSAIRFNGDFTLLYALRGQMRQTLGATADAENDFRIAQAHDLGATFDPWVSAALAGEWTCGNFFDYDLSGAGAQ